MILVRHMHIYYGILRYTLSQIVVRGSCMTFRYAPGLRAEADSGLLSVIIENLLSNALEMHTGSQSRPD